MIWKTVSNRARQEPSNHHFWHSETHSHHFLPTNQKRGHQWSSLASGPAYSTLLAPSGRQDSPSLAPSMFWRRKTHRKTALFWHRSRSLSHACITELSALLTDTEWLYKAKRYPHRGERLCCESSCTWNKSKGTNPPLIPKITDCSSWVSTGGRTANRTQTTQLSPLLQRKPLPSLASHWSSDGASWSQPPFPQENTSLPKLDFTPATLTSHRQCHAGPPQLGLPYCSKGKAAMGTLQSMVDHGWGEMAMLRLLAELCSGPGRKIFVWVVDSCHWLNTEQVLQELVDKDICLGCLCSRPSAAQQGAACGEAVYAFCVHHPVTHGKHSRVALRGLPAPPSYVPDRHYRDALGSSDFQRWHLPCT